MSLTDIAWLAGFYDGEGSFILAKKRNGGIEPRLAITNTVGANTSRVAAILSTVLGTAVTPRLYKAGPHRPQYHVYLSKMANIAAACEVMLPFLVGKRRQAELLLEYCDNPPGRTTSGKFGSTTTARHWEIAEEMGRLNKRYAPNEWSEDATTDGQDTSHAEGGDRTAATETADREAAEGAGVV